jgi:hypothetical protein
MCEAALGALDLAAGLVVEQAKRLGSPALAVGALALVSGLAGLTPAGVSRQLL